MNSLQRPPLYENLDYLGKADAYVDDVYDVISKGPLFEDFSRQEIAALCQYMHCFAAHRDTPLLNEGEDGDYLLIILSGKAVVRKIAPNGKQVDLAIANPGATLGEMSLIDGQHRFASCIAVDPTDVAVMTRDSLNDILITHSRLANKFLIRLLQILVVRLRDTGTSFLGTYLDAIN
jgi:CRP-like cAMP-binding protein